MHPILTTARLRRGAVIAATGALALGLLPLTGSSAAGVDSVSYVTSTGLAANVGAPNGTATQPLTAAGYRTFSLDVSTDGNTALLAVCHGSYAATATTSSGQCIDKPNGSSYDATFGLVLVHRGTGGTVRAKVLSTQWDANPVLTTSAGQTTAWFLLDGVLYSYAVSDTDVSGAPVVASASGLAPLKDAATGSLLESVTGLAVSSDGARAAATYLRPGLVSGRVKEITVATGAAVFQQTFSASRTASSVITFQPTASVLTFQGNSLLLFGEAQFAASGTPGNLKTFQVTGATTAAEVPTLAGFYGLRQTSTGDWWAWKDTGSAAAVSSVSNANLLTTAPAGPTSRADGSTTFGYVPSAVAPPSLSEVVGTNAAVLAVPAGHASLALSAKSVKFKGRAAVATQNFYWADLPGRAYNPKTANAAEVDKGTLLVSTNKTTWTKVATSGAAAFGIGSTYYNGYTPALRANTFFQWAYAGDSLTGPSQSSILTVTVVPTVAVKLAHSGRRIRVSGTITAWPGAMGLYVLRAGHWRTVASVTISKSAKTIGTYTFGYRSLAKGTYKVANRGTTGVGYASGAKTFKI